MTKEFMKIRFDPVRCRTEVLQLRELLETSRSLEERKNILPFFRDRLQLSAFVGSYHPEIVRCDRVAHELPLFGNFVADLVVGDSVNGAFTFIEFEDASTHSIFRKKRKKATPEWSTRFEHGFSQIVDWFFELDDQKSTIGFMETFGFRTIKHIGILVIGRTAHLGKRETDRFRWRQEKILLDSKTIYCKTFDQLCDDLLARLERLDIGPSPQAQS